jgi:hypothetical protein
MQTRIAARQHKEILQQLAKRPTFAIDLQLYELGMWHFNDQRLVKSHLAKLLGQALVEYDETAGYSLTPAGKQALEKLAPTPKPEEIPGVSEKAYAVMARRLRADLAKR